jgi:outer membrane protein, heavy metal efflux system
LRAARFGISVARGNLLQASVLLPNPTLDVLTRGEGAELGFTQEIEIAGQRGARRRAARAGIVRTGAAVTDIARLTIAEVDRGFFRLVAAHRRAALADDVLALNERLAGFAERQLAAGGISRFEFNLATVEFGRSRARALTARRELEATASEFRELLGLSPGTALIAITDEAPAVAITTAPMVSDSAGRDVVMNSTQAPTTTLSVDSLTVLAFARRPDLAERSAAIAEANAEVSVARREAVPSLAARVVSEQISGVRQLRPGIGLTIPFFSLNRGEIDARQSAAAQAVAEREAVVLRIRSEVARAARSYEIAAAETDVLQNTVLATARENRRLLEIAFEEGKVGLPVLLLIRNQVIDAELEFWDAWLAQREARAALAAATGENISGFVPTVTPEPNR